MTIEIMTVEWDVLALAEFDVQDLEDMDESEIPKRKRP